MKSKLPLLLIILFSSLQIYFGQNEIKPILFDELADEYCSEILALKLDMFSIELNKHSDSRAYIIFQGKNSQEGKNLLYLLQPQKYLGYRGIKEDKIVTIRGENKDKMTMQLWVVPNGATPPIIEKSFLKKEIDSTTLFDKSWADWYKWNSSEWTIYGYSFVEWGCEMDLNMKGFAETIHSQPNLTGYLVVYTKFGKGKNHAKKVTDFAIRELSRQHKVSKEKLKTIYGGNRNTPELELWVVPNGDNPPIPNPDKFIKKES
jgi:hypothetical protein